MQQNRSRDDWEETARANAATLEKKIEELEAEYAGLFSDLTGIFVKRNYRSFWERVKEINELFKTLKPLKREDRERSWNQLHNLCERVKREQNEGWEKRKRASQEEQDIIFRLVKDAHNWSEGAKEIRDIDQGRLCLTQAMDRLKGNKQILKEDHDHCFNAWKEANEALRHGRERVSENNWSNVRSDIQDILHKAQYGDPYEAQEDIKSCQTTTLKSTVLTSAKFEEARSLLDLAWKTASERIAKTKEEKRRRGEEWRDRQKSHVERWQANIEKAESTISRVLDQIRNCERMRDEASTGEFAGTVQGWIDEKEGFIKDVEGNIREWERKIRETEDKLNN